MTPTPRTKKATHTCGECGPRVDADFAEKLERENVELRKALGDLVATSTEASEVLGDYYFNGDYNNEDVIEVHGKLDSEIAAARSALGGPGSAPEPLPGQKNASTGRTGAREGS